MHTAVQGIYLHVSLIFACNFSPIMTNIDCRMLPQIRIQCDQCSLSRLTEWNSLPGKAVKLNSKDLLTRKLQITFPIGFTVDKFIDV